MPPAFNLSQDQTLQFDLEFALRNRSELHFSFHERLRSCDREPFDESIGSWHAPSNAHAYRLLIFKELRALLSHFASLSVISEDRDSHFFFNPLSSTRLLLAVDVVRVGLLSGAGAASSATSAEPTTIARAAAYVSTPFDDLSQEPGKSRPWLDRRSRAVRPGASREPGCPPEARAA